MQQEKLTPIKGYEEYYEVSDLGRIKSLAKEWITGERWGIRKKEATFLKFGKRGCKNQVYYFVVLCVDKVKKYKSVHRLVAEHFCPNPNGYNVVNHINSNTLDNRAVNLEWTTTKGNVQHSWEYGNKKPIRGEQHGNSKLKEVDVVEIKKLLKIGVMTHKEISEMYGVTRNVITRIKSGTRWQHI